MFWTQSKDNVYVAAHRGWSSVYPENTLEAFAAAADLGVDQIETDVRITADGELVVIHDAAVDRTTDGSGLVCEKTLAECKSLNAGKIRGEHFYGCRIPAFTEFMDLMKAKNVKTLDVELKEYPTPGREKIAYDVCDRVLRMIDDYGYTDRVVINTFSGKLHEYISRKYGKTFRRHVYYPKHFLGEITEDPYTDAYCVCMFGENSYIAEPEEFDRMRKTYGIHTWAGAGVKDEDSVKKALSCDAELITCNNPDEILRILRAAGKHE